MRRPVKDVSDEPVVEPAIPPITPTPYTLPAAPVEAPPVSREGQFPWLLYQGIDTKMVLDEGALTRAEKQGWSRTPTADYLLWAQSGGMR